MTLKRIFKGFLIGAGFIFLLLLIFSQSYESDTARRNVEQYQESINNPRPTLEPTPTEAVGIRQWVHVDTFTGDADKTTDPFMLVGDRWRITYKNEGSYLSIVTYKTPDQYQDLLVSRTTPGSDTTVIYGNGEYYLDIGASGPWEVIVESHELTFPQ